MKNKTKYYKILITLSIWHIKPYKITFVAQGNSYVEYGILCFKLIIG